MHLDPVVCGIVVLGNLRVGFFFAHTARNELVALRCEPFVRDKHFLLSVVHFFLVHVHSLDAFIRRAGVDKVFFALDHSADVVRECLAVLGCKLELAVVLHKQGAVVNDVISVLVFVISRICKVFVRIESRAVVERPVVDTVAFLVHAGVKGFVRIDVARALSDADDVKVACFRTFCVLELGHAHLGCKDVERDFIIPQIEIERDERIAQRKRIDCIQIVADCGVRARHFVGESVQSRRVDAEFLQSVVFLAVVDLSLARLRVQHVVACQ